MDTTQKGFISRMAEYFGRQPGQNTSDFGDEIKELTREDQLWIVAEFNRQGMPTADPAPTFPHSIKRSKAN